MTDAHRRGPRMTAVALLVLLTTAAGPLAAAPVGYGNSVIDIQGTPANYTYCSQTPAADVTYDVFGTPVNLGTQAGTILCVGTFSGGEVTSSCTSYPDAGQISYDGSTGELFLSNVMGSIPASISDVMFVGETTDAFDSYVLGSSIPNCPLNPSDFSAHHVGAGALNAFEKIATPTGVDVTISSDTTMVNLFTLGEVRVAVDVTFAQVDTAGETTAGARVQSAVPLPANYSADVGGYKAPYIGVLTSAAVSGMITICGRYDDANDDGILDGTTVRETDLSLMRADGVSPAFVDRTSSRDPVSNTICAEMSALAPIVVAVRTNGSCGPGDEGNPCNDGNACTTNDTCVSQVCSGGAASCNDANPCTDDACVGITGCGSTPNAAACDDGLFCNGSDTCSGGACVHAGDPCTGGAECDDACNETADNCAVTAGTGCTDDGNPCTGDQCDGVGACQHPFNSAPCADEGNGCTDDVCAGGSCTHPANSAPCADEGNGCTDDVCAGGSCTHPSNTAPCADDGNGCTDDVCTAGSCSHPDNNATCDDGNACTGAGSCGGGTCQPGAPILVCGDGVPCGSEECDDGNANETDGCTTACMVQVCGNGDVEPPEDCDDGNVTAGDGCSALCAFEGCDVTGTWNGDSLTAGLRVRFSEDGSGTFTGGFITSPDPASFTAVTGTRSGPAITVVVSASLQVSGALTDCATIAFTSPAFTLTRISDTFCGDGSIDAVSSEECDDGNFANADACDATCQLPNCGNAVLDQGEECDDANQQNGDGCDNNCTAPACGNGALDPSEQCDQGNQNGAGACSATCTLPNCGNGATDPGEQCDDGNQLDGDLCARNCTLPGCGNGITEGAESCDDGNTFNCDECSATCEEEDDSDGDNSADACDNCPDDYNPSQNDRDENGIGDSCDVPIEAATGAGSPSTVAIDLSGPGAFASAPFSALNITYDAALSAGVTSIQVLEVPPGETLDGGFRFAGAGGLFHIDTTATTSGPIELCFTYEESAFAPGEENNLKLLHEEGGTFVDRTTQLDTDANLLCGEVSSFSRFAIGIALNPVDKARLSVLKNNTVTADDRLRSLVVKLLPPPAATIDPALTGMRVTLLRNGDPVFQRFISGAQWTVTKPGKLYKFDDPAGTLLSGITKAKVKLTPSAVKVKLAGIHLDLSMLDGSALELRCDFGTHTFVSSITCTMKEGLSTTKLKCAATL